MDGRFCYAFSFFVDFRACSSVAFCGAKLRRRRIQSVRDRVSYV